MTYSSTRTRCIFFDLIGYCTTTNLNYSVTTSSILRTIIPNTMKFVLAAVASFALICPPVNGLSSPISKKAPSLKDGNNLQVEGSSRRAFFRESLSSVAIPLLVSGVAGTLSLIGSPLIANAEDAVDAAPVPVKEKVLVLGGSGFVGSRVVSNLQSQGIEVIATSTNGRDGTVAFDVTKSGIEVAKEIESLSKGCKAVISCIGSIGAKDDYTINAATGLAAKGAKASGVERFVYIAVAPEVKEFAEGIDFLKDYIKGKTFSQDAVESSFPNSSHVFIEP